MVDAVTSYSRSGLRDWLLQRVTSVLMAGYTIFLAIFFIKHPHLQYADWRHLFSCNMMRVSTLLVFLSFLIHGWIGLWTVFTDYIQCSWGRLFLQTVVVLLLMIYVIWGIGILWS